MVVHIAVSATAGLTSMFIDNENGISFSLSKPTVQSDRNSRAKRDGHIVLYVPSVTLSQLLKAIPTHIAIPYIKTDMQGHDIAAVSSTQDYLSTRNADLSSRAAASQLSGC